MIGEWLLRNDEEHALLRQTRDSGIAALGGHEFLLAKALLLSHDGDLQILQDGAVLAVDEQILQRLTHLLVALQKEVGGDTPDLLGDQEAAAPDDVEVIGRAPLDVYWLVPHEMGHFGMSEDGPQLVEGPIRE